MWRGKERRERERREKTFNDSEVEGERNEGGRERERERESYPTILTLLLGFGLTDIVPISCSPCLIVRQSSM